MICFWALLLLFGFLGRSIGGLQRPTECDNGHKCRWQCRFRRFSSSFRCHCWLCGEQHSRMSTGGAHGGRISRRRSKTDTGSTHKSRSAATWYSDCRKTPAEQIFFLEVWANRLSKITKVAAFCGSYAVRVCKPNKLFIRTSDAPALTPGKACTVFLDLSLPQDQKLLKQFCETWLKSNNSITKTVVLTSPECRMFNRRQAITLSRFRTQLRRKVITRGIFDKKMNAFDERRRSAIAAVQFAGSLHKWFDEFPTYCVHIHEQPVNAVRPRAGRSLRSYLKQDCEWPAAFKGDAFADVATCKVCYFPGSAPQKRFGKKLRFQVKGSDPILHALQAQHCECSVPHDKATPADYAATAAYSTTLAHLIVRGALCK